MATLIKLSLLCLWVFLLLVTLCFNLTESLKSGSLFPWKKVRCNLFYRCYQDWQYCPVDCPRTCVMDCAACKPVCSKCIPFPSSSFMISCNYPGAVCQDPRFVGGDGITFYFHGKKDHDFCLVSDENLHINAHFIGKRNTYMKRDFTWVQSLGILFNTHKLLVAAKKTSKWIDNVDHLSLAFDSQPISLPSTEGAKWQPANMPHIMLTRPTNTNGVTVEVTGNFKVTAVVVPITEEESRVHGYNISSDIDCFAHLELGFKFYNLSDNVDGVLGQTYRKNYVSKAKMGVLMPVLGGDDKFSSSHLFSTDCAVSRFGRGGQMLRDDGGAGAGVVNYGTLQCNSGLQGHGVVCKK